VASATARNRAIDVVRRNRRGRELVEQVAADRIRSKLATDEESADVVPDDQLKLIFTCCTPRPQ